MSDEPIFEEDAPQASHSGSPPPVSPARKKRSSLPILLALAAGLCLFCCVGAPVGYFLFGIEKSSDPAEIRAAFESMIDAEIPSGLEPFKKTVQITGVESVEFRSTSQQSFLDLRTGPRFGLQHAGTLRESRDRGRDVGGGSPETPINEEIITETIRGQPAEFIYRRYSDNETVSGYLQGKVHVVHFEAELSHDDFEPGTALLFAESIR